MSCLVKAKDLQKLVKEKGLPWTLHNLQESYDKKEITPDDVSIKDLVAHTIPDGRELIDNWERDRRRGGHVVTEAAHAVDTSAMSHITGQLFFNAIKDGMVLDQLIGDQLVSDFPSKIQGTELVPGIGGVEDEFDTNVIEGEDYPLIGLAEEYMQLPSAEKKGAIIGLTREAIIADRTGVLIQRARSLGKGLAIRREKSIIDVVIGAVNPYFYKGEARLTYGDGVTAGQALGFLNEATAALVDFTDIQEVAELFYAMRDPITSEPLGHNPDTIICCKNLSWPAYAVMHDTEVQLVDRAAAAGQIGSIGANRIPTDYKCKILSNEWVTQAILAANGGAGGITAADRDAANLHWFIGKPTEAFVWKTIWPLTVEEAPNNSEAQFMQDVWMRFKGSYKGVAGVQEPRLMIRSDGTA